MYKEQKMSSCPVPRDSVEDSTQIVNNKKKSPDFGGNFFSSILFSADGEKVKKNS